MTKNSSKTLPPGVIVGVVVVVSWAIVVWLSGQGWNPSGVKWDFTNTGQLGDSFGVLSAGMAGIAAYFAFRTYRSARDDSTMLEQRAFEASYLNLLERRYDVLDRVRYIKATIVEELGEDGEETDRTDRQEWPGQQAIDAIAAQFDYDQRYTSKTLEDSFKDEAADTFGLTNLFRFTYHIVAFADRQRPPADTGQPVKKTDQAYQLVRLLRAQLSDSELLVVAVNCAVDEGREKFKPLVERYALLHNMSPDTVDQFSLTDLFEPEAFGLEEADRLWLKQPAADGDPGTA